MEVTAPQYRSCFPAEGNSTLRPLDFVKLLIIASSAETIERVRQLDRFVSSQEYYRISGGAVIVYDYMRMDCEGSRNNCTTRDITSEYGDGDVTILRDVITSHWIAYMQEGNCSPPTRERFMRIRSNIRRLTSLAAVPTPTAHCPILPAEVWVELTLQCDWQSLRSLVATCRGLWSLRNHYFLRGVTQQRIYFREAMVELLMITSPERLFAAERDFHKYNIRRGITAWITSSYCRRGWATIYAHATSSQGGHSYVDRTTLLVTRVALDAYRLNCMPLGLHNENVWFARYNYTRIVLREGGRSTPRRVTVECAVGPWMQSTPVCEPVNLHRVYMGRLLRSGRGN